jgi:hypothetical protein
MNPVQFASIVPLDYGDRQEFSVIFATLDWEDLGPLLTNPIDYLAAISSSWRQQLPGGSPRIEWDLLSPVTVVMEWFGNSINSVMKLSDFAVKMFVLRQKDSGTTFKAASEALSSKLSIDVIETLKPLVARPNDLRYALDDFFPDGALYVEFAVNTHTITVHYHPPKADPAMKRFGGDFTNATLVTLPSAEDAPIMGAALHFDIGRDHRERAYFVCDYLQDFNATLSRAIDTADQLAQSGHQTSFGVTAKKFRKASAKLCCKGQQIAVEEPERSDHPNIAALEDLPLPTLILETTPSKAVVAAVSAASKPFAADVTEDTTCQICIEINGVYQPDPNVFYPGTTIVKCYVAPKK